MHESPVHSWVIGDGRIRTAFGEAVTTDEVLERLASHRETIREELPLIRFSRIALEPRVRLRGNFPTEMFTDYGLTKNGALFPAKMEQDHVIVGSTWHPVNIHSRAIILEELGLLDCGIGRIDAASSIQLCASFNASAWFVDEVERSEATQWAVSSAGVALPIVLAADLYPYQVIGFEALKKLADNNLGALLADQMGLGKTLQAIALIASLDRSQQVLIVVPASLIENWTRELALFAPTLQVLPHSGPKRCGVATYFLGVDIVLTTYETVVADIKLLSDVKWDLVVLDEAQKIRNPTSQRAIATKQLPRRIGLAVTGTPVENSLRDLWSISEFVIPSLLGGLATFESQFPDNVDAATRLGKIITPMTIRRRVAEVAADLPVKVEILKAFALSDEDWNEYKDIQAKGSAFETNTELRVLCAHARESSAQRSAGFIETPKVEHLSDLLEEIFQRGESALIFGSYSLCLVRLQAHFYSKFPTHHFNIFDGGVALLDRQPVIDRFTSNPLPGALLLNPQAGGVGLNITAANHVVHFNPEYNPAVTEQATARAYRIKQELPVFVHHLFYSDTVEEAAVRIASAKRDVARGFDAGVRGSDGKALIE